MLGYYKLVIDRHYDITVTGYSIKVGSLNETLSSCEETTLKLNESLESCQERESTKMNEIQTLSKNILDSDSKNTELSRNLTNIKKEFDTSTAKIKSLEIELNQTYIDLEQFKEAKTNCTEKLSNCSINLNNCLNP